MQPTTDRFGNYQASLTDNGIWTLPGFGPISTYAGNYAGAQPNFTPTQTIVFAIDTSNQTQWLWSNNAWTEFSTGGGGSVNVLIGNYGGASPPLVTPSFSTGLVVDQPAGGLWTYQSGVWTALIAP